MTSTLRALADTLGQVGGALGARLSAKGAMVAGIAALTMSLAAHAEAVGANRVAASDDGREAAPAGAVARALAFNPATSSGAGLLPQRADEALKGAVMYAAAARLAAQRHLLELEESATSPSAAGSWRAQVDRLSDLSVGWRLALDRLRLAVGALVNAGYSVSPYVHAAAELSADLEADVERSRRGHAPAIEWLAGRIAQERVQRASLHQFSAPSTPVDDGLLAPRMR